eukprot:5775785-Pyramimonas_sp.AAC.1
MTHTVTGHTYVGVTLSSHCMLARTGLGGSSPPQCFLAHSSWTHCANKAPTSMIIYHALRCCICWLKCCLVRSFRVRGAERFRTRYIPPLVINILNARCLERLAQWRSESTANALR